MNRLFRTLRGGRLWVLGLLFFAYGCNIGDIPDLENTYLPPYEGEVAIVLVKDTLRMQEFLDKTISDSSSIVNGPNQEVVFQYETNADYTVGSNFVEVKSFSNSEFISNPIPFTYVTTSDTTLTINESFEFDFPSSNKEEIDSVFYNSGMVELVVQSEFPGELEYSFSINSFVKMDTQVPLYFTDILPSTNSIVSQSQSEALEGYKTNLVRQGDSNKFVANVVIDIRIPQGTTMTGAEEVYLDLNVIDPAFQTVFGFFGEDQIDIAPKTISIGLFADFTGTGIDFESPNITLQVENSFGIPISLDFSQVRAEYDDRDDLLFTGAIADNVQTLNAPGVSDYLDPVKRTTILINPDNSNIRELLSSTPERLVFPLTGFSNLGSTDQNFVSESSRIDINAIMELPLSLRLEDFEYNEEIELSDLSQLSDTESLSLLLHTVNQIPFDGVVDLLFNDANGHAIDSLISSMLFVAPTSYDAAGKATEPSVNTTTIDLDASKIEALTSASSITLVIRLNSFGNTLDEFVRLFADYELTTTVSVLGKVSVDLNSN